MNNGIASTAIGKVGTIQIERTKVYPECFDRKRTKRGPRRWESLFHDCKERERSDEAEQTVEVIKGAQRDAKRRKETKRDATEREDAERNEHNTGSTTT